MAHSTKPSHDTTKWHFSFKNMWSRNTVQEKTFATTAVPYFPGEILFEIAERVVSPRDIINFCLTSKSAYKLLLPALYISLDLISFEICKDRLEFLIAHPELARRVRKLVLRPSCWQVPTTEALDNETWVTKVVELLAPNLHALHTFIWDGLEMPDDRIWWTLRNSCLQLSHVGSTIGSRNLDPESHLFSFKNLVGFSLTSKYRTIHRTLGDKPGEVLPNRLWDMLLNHCPQLEDLTIGSLATSSTRLFDVRPLSNGRWPTLRSLSLGYTMMLDRDSSPETGRKNARDFVSFMTSHPALKSVHFPYPSYYPSTFDLSGSAVRLRSFSGTIPFIFNFLPFSELKELNLASEEHPSWSLSFVERTLKQLPSLTTLAIWIDLSSSHKPLNPIEKDPETDHIKVFHSILGCCPQLLHFKVFCSTKSKYTFSMKEFSRALQDASRLETIEVVKVHTFGEGNMLQNAARIARDVPNLKRISLLSAERSWSLHNRILARHIGTYAVVAGDDGQAVGLYAKERGFGRQPFVRCFEHSLLPRRERLASTFKGFLAGESDLQADK